MDDIVNRHGVLLAWGLLAAIIGVLVGGIAVPLFSAYFERADQIDNGYLRLSKLESIARLRPDEVRKQAAAVDKALGAFAFVGVEGADRLTLELRKKMEALAQDFSVRLQSVETTTSSREDDIESVVLKITAEAEPDGAFKLLESLRSNSPLLAVDEVLLYAGSARRRGRGSKSDTAEALAQPVSMSFRLEAFLAPRG